VDNKPNEYAIIRPSALKDIIYVLKTEIIQ